MTKLLLTPTSDCALSFSDEEFLPMIQKPTIAIREGKLLKCVAKFENHKSFEEFLESMEKILTNCDNCEDIEHDTIHGSYT